MKSFNNINQIIKKLLDVDFPLFLLCDFKHFITQYFIKFRITLPNILLCFDHFFLNV